MRQEFEMTQEEMDHIIAIIKGGGDPVMFLSGGVPMGSSIQERINQYWEILGNKYGFIPHTAEGSAKGKLFFIAEPKPVVVPKTQTEIEVEKYIGNAKGYIGGDAKEALRKIVAQFELGKYESQGGYLTNNIAFIALKELSI